MYYVYVIEFSNVWLLKVNLIYACNRQLNAQCLEGPVSILSLHGENILLGTSGTNQLYLYCCDGGSFHTITTLSKVRDAVLIRDQIIIYTTDTNKITRYIFQSKINYECKVESVLQPCGISVDGDGGLYVADWNNGIFYSHDDGITWTEFISSSDVSNCWRATYAKYSRELQVSVDGTANKQGILWTQQYDLVYISHVMTKQNELKATCLSASNVINTDNINVGSVIHAKDDYVFVSDRQNKQVHQFLMNGEHQGIILHPNECQDYPWSLAFDSCQSLLYVGDNKGKVNIFKLAEKSRFSYQLMTE